jgi:hypothetical protein
MVHIARDGRNVVTSSIRNTKPGTAVLRNPKVQGGRMETCVTIDHVNRRQERRIAAPQWCPRGISKTQRRRLQKMHQKEITEKREEEDWDKWFNHPRPMTIVKYTWREKRLAREENSEEDSGSSSGTERDAEEETGHSNNGDGQQARTMEMNMVLTIPVKFHAPERSIVELTLGAEKVVFEKLKKNGGHVKPLFIKGHLEGTPME